MNSKHRRTLELIYKDPIPANLKWKDIENLFIHLGADIKEGNGSRVRIELNKMEAVFHRPHPQPDAKKYLVKSVRQLLKNAGVTYDEI